ncbi:M15 family metallopeptidase [Prochlorococcus marinus]|uniref:Peptidase M15 n=1 Tax=Prochlorococcus marinus XMU1408 TaxID=2213228 RepID=A0A318R0T6_PROMR|nr:M15 family metallopeptidase [Prochlorococcus marinus]MBW3041762.1 peptidase M15 [Prochlorococcus marinus str. XMU1408]PYE02906.1 peptidase M15 [Prochlorococcus marinus XMU1408]
MNYQDDIPLAKRIKSIKTISTKSFVRIGLVSFGLGLLLTLLANKSVLLQIKSSDNSINTNETIQNKSLLGHLPYPEASKDELVLFSPGIYVHKDIYENFKEMQLLAAQRGISLQLLSGYRSINLQRDIFYENKSIRNQTAIERSRDSAPPGYSEHSTGYAIDVGDGNYPNTHFEVEFEETPAFKFMKRFASKYHFVLSFPPNNKQGVTYEPWHWRFEGTVNALRKFEAANKITKFK